MRRAVAGDGREEIPRRGGGRCRTEQHQGAGCPLVAGDGRPHQQQLGTSRLIATEAEIAFYVVITNSAPHYETDFITYA